MACRRSSAWPMRGQATSGSTRMATPSVSSSRSWTRRRGDRASMRGSAHSMTCCYCEVSEAKLPKQSCRNMPKRSAAGVSSSAAQPHARAHSAAGGGGECTAGLAERRCAKRTNRRGSALFTCRSSSGGQFIPRHCGRLRTGRYIEVWPREPCTGEIAALTTDVSVDRSTELFSSFRLKASPQ